jgi:hypothetical protein
MSSHNTSLRDTVDTVANGRGRFAFGAFAVALYVLSVAVTKAPFIADTPAYAAQIAGVRDGSLPATDLWEFGHILWRPLCWLVAPLFALLTPDSIAWTPRLKIVFGMVVINYLSGLVTVLVMADLIRRFVSRWIAVVTLLAIVIWGDAFLSYAQSGSSYIPALAMLAIGIWWQVTSRSVNTRLIVGSAICYGVAALFWFPFVLVIPAAAAARRFARNDDAPRLSWGQVIRTTVISGSVLVVGIGGGAVLAGIRSGPEFLAWQRSADHGWKQNRQWMRAVSGCSRLFIDLGSDGVQLKRFTFKDPYNPVNKTDLIRILLSKIGVFYLFIASVMLLAATTAAGRRLLVLLLIGGVPVLFFAIFLFEPSAPERFLPLLPILMMALAAGWSSSWRMAGALRGMVGVFAILLLVLNWTSFVSRPLDEQARAQVLDFRKFAKPGDVLVTVLLQDPVVHLTEQRMFDMANRPEPVKVSWMINTAVADAASWRQQFAGSILKHWSEGRQVWVTKAALQDRPDRNSAWVEGDNPALHWADIPAFLKTLSFDQQTDRPDGYSRLMQSPEMQSRLSELSTVRGDRRGGRDGAIVAVAVADLQQWPL